MSKESIYGQDMQETDKDGFRIAEIVLGPMRKDQKTSEAEKCTGDDASKSELDSLLK